MDNVYKTSFNPLPATFIKIMKFISENNSVKIREKISEKRAVPEMHEDKPLAGPKFFFWASKKLESLAQMA